MTIETKEKVIEWIFQQGVSTVLLCGILIFLAYAVLKVAPVHINQIEQGYQRNAEILNKSLDKMVESHDKDRQMFVDLLNGRQLVKQP